MKAASFVFRHRWLYQFAGKVARTIVPWLPRFMVYNRLNTWGKQRELPPMPRRSFRELYAQRKNGRTNGK
jgi:L-lactate dehydrogenase complex protein LldF